MDRWIDRYKEYRLGDREIDRWIGRLQDRKIDR